MVGRPGAADRITSYNVCYTKLLRASSHELSNTVEQISRGAETQAETVERTTKLIREMAISTELVASSARKVSEAVDVSVQTAQQGGETALV